MFQHQKIWLPDGEKHFPEWMNRNGELVDGRGTYQIQKLRASMEHVRGTHVAVDVGAHVGLWSMHLAKHFENVLAFEPVAQFRECFERNVTDAGVKLYAMALGSAPGKVRMVIDPADTGGTHVDATAEEGTVILETLDNFELARCDFLKIDCEGYELQILEGARETLLRCRPCVIVEQKAHKLGVNYGIKGTPAVDYLKDLGMTQRRVMSGDYILSW